MVDSTRLVPRRLRVTQHIDLGPSQFTEFTAGDTIHLVRNLRPHDAIDLPFCFPRGPHEALRFAPRRGFGQFAVGGELAVDAVADHPPVLMAEPEG